MKIAEALVHIKDMKGKLAELNREIMEEQTFEQVDASMEIPSVEQQLKDFVSLTKELASFKTRITKTNSKHGLTDKIHKMEALRSMVSRLEQLCRNKQVTVTLRRIDYEGPAVSISTHATYNVEQLTKEVNGARDQIRVLDLELQRLNWEIDLEE